MVNGRLNMREEPCKHLTLQNYRITSFFHFSRLECIKSVHTPKYAILYSRKIKNPNLNETSINNFTTSNQNN